MPAGSLSLRSITRQSALFLTRRTRYLMMPKRSVNVIRPPLCQPLDFKLAIRWQLHGFAELQHVSPIHVLTTTSTA